jgi:hypothetical protein
MSAGVLAWQAPFGWVLIASVLLALYQRYRDRGVVLGLLLLMLANCSAQSVLLAGAFGHFLMPIRSYQLQRSSNGYWFARVQLLALLEAAKRL